ncbi:hypothetical protein, partial [Hydrotalea sp. AMD]|uniref:hypothetical protein n=1 Tax=Hydrotalea sp. AMD TaxID=2501297 RepID=UPI00257FE605
GRNIFFNQPTDQVPLFVCDIHKCRFSYKRQIHSIYYKKHTFETCSINGTGNLDVFIPKTISGGIKIGL